MQPASRLQSAPRCAATSKRTGKRCRAPAVRGWPVCRMHGARGGAPRGKRNGAWRHGLYEGDNTERLRAVRQLLRRAKGGLG